MNWHNDPRIKKLLEKATLENLMKIYFRRVYGVGEVQEMENALKNALEKYSKKDLIYEKLLENNENEAKPLMTECLDTLCEKPLNHGKNHTPSTLLALAQIFIKVGDYRLACEIIWCCASLSIQEFIANRGLKVRLHSHDGKRRFARALSDEIGNSFAVFEACHSSFYTNRHNRDDVNDALKQADKVIQLLRTFQMTDEKKNELDKKNFD